MKSFNNTKPLTYDEMLNIENKIYEEQIINNEVKSEQVIIENIMKRELGTFCDKTFNFPQHIFLIDNYKGNILVGRKIKSVLSIENKINAFHCSMITSSMLLGFFIRKEENGKDVKVHYYPFTKGEKVTIFNEIKHDKMINLYYPFKYRHFSTNEEEKSPNEGWSLNPEKVVYLGYGEEHIRDYTITFLRNIVKHDMVIYDPACSTGQFLNTIKKAYPFVKTIGQDLSREMCDYAKDYVDEIYYGDSINSQIKDNSVDIMFLRFLNSEVVTTEYAYKLFDSLIKKVKNKGKIIAFGHTALLIEDSYFKECGLITQQRIAYDKKYDAIFQYYVLEKEE